MIPKYCSIFKAHGAKRLASDVLIGLERLLPLFCPAAKMSDLIALFPTDRLDRDKPGGVQRTYEWIFDHDRMLGGGAEPSDAGLVNLCEVGLPELVPEGCPEEIPARHQGTWTKCQSAMRMFLSHEARDGEMLAHIVWRLGREAGKIRRILSDNGISWGFFYDHDPNEPNNASLPDNFVLMPEGHEQLIAPINFDLAYTRESFLLGTARSAEALRWPTEDDLGEQDNDKFTKWLNREKYSLEMALGGDKGLANTDYCDQGIDTHLASLLMTALTDTCVLGYRSGFKMEPDAYPMDEDLQSHTYDLLQMALCLSD